MSAMSKLAAARRAWEKHAKAMGFAIGDEERRTLFIAGFLAAWGKHP